MFTRNKRNQHSDVTDIYLSLKLTSREFATVNYLYTNSTMARASLQQIDCFVVCSEVPSREFAKRVCNGSTASSPPSLSVSS